MSTSWKNRLPMALGAALLVAALVAALSWQPARAQRGEGAGGGGPHYTVVDSEGHNLIVTDNHNNTLYFYTIDKDAKIGSDLKLRGKVDLKQVGKPVIKPSDVKEGE
jgi:hypothetical protein